VPWHEGRAALRPALDHLRGVRAAVRAGELAVIPQALYADAGRALRAYDAYGPTPAVASSVEDIERRLGAVREELQRELRRRQAADVPDIGWRDRRGEPWAPRLRPVQTTRRERPWRAEL